MTNLEIIVKQNTIIGKLTLELQKLKAEKEDWRIFHKDRAEYYLANRGELPGCREGIK